MEKINGIIKDGRVYVADPEYASCRTKCALRELCDEVDLKFGYSPCVINAVDGKCDFGYRYSPELTELLAKPLCPEKTTTKKLNKQ